MALHLRDGESAATRLSATRAIWAGLAEQMRRRVVPHSPASSLEANFWKDGLDGTNTGPLDRHLAPVKADLSHGFPPAVPFLALGTAIAGDAQPGRILRHHISQGEKRLKLAPTSCQAASTTAAGTTDPMGV
jgi:hypothetical protein